MTKPKKYKCAACGKRSHNVRTCPNRKHCSACKRAGHNSRACPNLWKIKNLHNWR